MQARLVSFATKRFALATPQIFLITVFSFFVIRLLPGDPAVELAGTHAAPETVAGIRRQLGLDRPVIVQYWTYLNDLVRNNWGRSWFTGNSVASDLADRAPATIELITCATLVIVIAGIGLGAVTAMFRLGAVTRILRGYSFLSGGFPDFWLALVAAYIFFYLLGWAPSPTGRLDLGARPPSHITGLYLVDSLLTGDLTTLRSAAGHLVLPTATLVVVYTAPIMKLTHSSVEKMLESEYCRYARACGLSEFTILRYALRNSLPPSIALVGIIYGYLLGGAVLVENVYSWGGLGSYVVSAIQHSDYFAIQAFILISAIVNLIVFLLVDLLHFCIDPRVEG